MIRRRSIIKPPEEMNTSAKEGSFIEDCSLKTAIFRAASSSLANRDSNAGMSAWSMVVVLETRSGGFANVRAEGQRSIAGESRHEPARRGCCRAKKAQQDTINT